jgi:hypothetical protein
MISCIEDESDPDEELAQLVSDTGKAVDETLVKSWNFVREKSSATAASPAPQTPSTGHARLEPEKSFTIWWSKKKATATECQLETSKRENVMLLELIRGVHDPKLREEFLRQKKGVETPESAVEPEVVEETPKKTSRRTSRSATTPEPEATSPAGSPRRTSKGPKTPEPVMEPEVVEQPEVVEKPVHFLKVLVKDIWKTGFRSSLSQKLKICQPF